jgi:hypothetical protein
MGLKSRIVLILIEAMKLVLALVVLLVILWFIWLIFLSPRGEIEQILASVDPATHQPFEAIKEVLWGNEWANIRFFVIMGFIAWLADVILIAVSNEIKERGKKEKVEKKEAKKARRY